MLGAPAHPDEEVAGRTARPGVAVGLCRTAAGGELSFVEASRMPGSGALTLTGRQGEVMRESARAALSWLRANAGRYGLDPAFHRSSDVHLHVQSGEVAKEGASAGVTMAAALVSAFTGRVVRGDLAMTGEITLSGQVLPVGGIKEKVLAAHRCGIARVVLPQQNQKQVDEDLGDDLRRAVEVHYVTQVDDLLTLALRPAPPVGGHAGRPGVLSPGGRAAGDAGHGGARRPLHGACVGGIERNAAESVTAGPTRSHSNRLTPVVPVADGVGDSEERRFLDEGGSSGEIRRMGQVRAVGLEHGDKRPCSLRHVEQRHRRAARRGQPAWRRDPVSRRAERV